MDTFKKVKKILVDTCCVNEGDVEYNSNLHGDLGLDSLEEVEFIMKVEKEFNITVPDGDMLNFKTVGDVVEFIDLDIKNSL